MDHRRDLDEHPRSTKRMWRVLPLSQVEKEEEFIMSSRSLSMMRKARSLDFSALLRHDHEDDLSCVASKFSQHEASFACGLLPR